MANRQSEEKLLSMQSSKSTHPLSKLKGPAAIYFNEVTQDFPLLKQSRSQMGEDGLTSSLPNICKGYKDSQESLCMVNRRDTTEMSI